MNAYEVLIYQSVYHNETFVVNDSRTEVIHAYNKHKAEAKVKLQKGSSHTHFNDSPNPLTIRTSGEYIESIYPMGQVRIVTKRFYEYSNPKYGLREITK